MDMDTSQSEIVTPKDSSSILPTDIVSPIFPDTSTTQLSSTAEGTMSTSASDPSTSNWPFSSSSEFPLPTSDAPTSFESSVFTPSSSDSQQRSSSTPEETPSSDLDASPTTLPPFTSVDPEPTPTVDSTSEVSIPQPSPSTTTPPYQISFPLPSPTTFTLTLEPSTISVPFTVYDTPLPSISTADEPTSLPPVVTVVESSQTTVTVTRVYTTTYNGTYEATVTSLIETGILRTDVPMRNLGISSNSGAIIGVTLGSTFAFLVVIILLFFFCRRHRRSSRQSSGPQLEEAVWRPPFRDEDESVRGIFQGAAAAATRLVRKLSNRSSSGHDEKSVDGADTGSVGFVAALPRVSEGSGKDGAVSQLSCAVITSPDGGPILSKKSQSSSSQSHVTGGNSTSSSESHAERGFRYTVDDGANGASSRTRISLSGPRPRPESRRPSYSTPPISFPISEMGETDRKSEKGSIRGLLSKLTKRPTSSHSNATVKSPSISSQTHVHTFFGSTESLVENMPSGSANSHKSPEPILLTHTLPYDSLLNPSPAVLFPVSNSPSTPPQPLLSFPRGITGNSYTVQSISPPPPSLRISGDPTPPSPAATDTSSFVVKESLLHPKLGMALQASQASLRDHEDYSRPISGLVTWGKSAMHREDSVSSGGSNPNGMNTK
ncbi:hypothetical protein FA15DRAFT_657046 [Coprinopsis marcescibilis]|uniref:REJ domain-containing protein n=1 Tax=Coprinopsis marcescibilis TaxID=230819 RepID=A0A5C3KR36_COPMA|nr:hypothetical protein FA15DRAFT_657046 [Coprinopsis marcescibilis]